MESALAIFDPCAALPNELVNAINHDRVCIALDHGERLVAEGKPRVVVMIPDKRQLYAPLAIQLLSLPDAEEGS